MNQILGAAWRLYRRHFGIIAGLVLTIGLPCQALSSYVSYEVFGRAKFLQALQAGALIELLFGTVIVGGILHALFVDRMNRQPTYLECLSQGVSHWFQLCWTNFLMSCLIAMASILFFLPIGTWQLRLLFLLPAMILAIRFSLAITLVMTEGIWGTAALRRSVRLTGDKSWQILLLCLVVYLPVQAAGYIGIGMLQTNPQFDSWPVTAFIGTLLKLVSCILTVCFFCLYEKVIAEDRPED